MPEIPLVELVAAISSALLTILGGIASTNAFSTVLIKVFRKELAARFLSYSGIETATLQLPAECSAGQPSEPPRLPKTQRALHHLRLRLTQAAKLGKRNVVFSEIYKWSARALSFVQYIVGGVLTLSFVKQSFSPPPSRHLRCDLLCCIRTESTLQSISECRSFRTARGPIGSARARYGRRHYCY
jgi:hypothetical protein